MSIGQRKAAAPAKSSIAPLARVLRQSEQVQDKVTECATELSSVNTSLQDHLENDAPLGKVADTLEQSSKVELKVQEAAEELVAVNDALAAEIDDRESLEGLLVRSETALRDSQVKERRSRHDALHDAGTGLPNLTLFNDRLENALAQARRHDWKVAVMFFDLDDFKVVNDSHGHDVGDGLLRLVAERLQTFVRGGDTVSRRSGDEFLFLMLEAKSADNARRMANQLRAAIAAPCVIDGVHLSIGASVGVAMFPANGATPAELLKHADLDMYKAKRRSSDQDPVPAEAPIA